MGRTRVGRTQRLLVAVALLSAWVLASAPVAAAGNATGINVTLPVGGRYTGHVVDAKTGLGIAGVRVIVEPTDGQGGGTGSDPTETDATGAYTIIGLYRGVTYDVTFYPNDDLHVEGCWSGNATHFVADCGSTPAPKPVATGTSLGTTKLPRGASLGGVVKGGTATSSVVLGGVQVEIEGSASNTWKWATTAADGTWSAGGLPADTYEVRFDAPPTRNYRDGYYRKNTTGTNWSAGAPTLVTIGTANATANVILPTGRTVTGYIKTSAGSPIAGATVRIGEMDPLTYAYGDVTTDSTGKFVYKGMGPGTGYLLGVSRPDGRNLMDGYYRSGATGNFTYDEAKASPFPIGTTNVTLPDIKVWTGYTITGKVLMPDGSPAKGAWAGNNAWASRWDETDSTGVFTIVGILPGTYRPWIGSPVATAIGGWFDAATPTYRLTQDEAAADAKTLNTTTKTWNIGTVRLRSATASSHSISGLVMGGTATLGGARVSGFDWNAFARGSATSAADGTYKMTGLKAASYVIDVSSPAGKNYVSGYYRAGVTGNWTRNESLATPVVVGP